MKIIFVWRRKSKFFVEFVREIQDFGYLGFLRGLISGLVGDECEGFSVATDLVDELPERDVDVADFLVDTGKGSRGRPVVRK